MQHPNMMYSTNRCTAVNPKSIKDPTKRNTTKNLHVQKDGLNEAEWICFYHKVSDSAQQQSSTISRSSFLKWVRISGWSHRLNESSKCRQFNESCIYHQFDTSCTSHELNESFNIHRLNKTFSLSTSHVTYTNSIRQSQSHELNVPSDSRNPNESCTHSNSHLNLTNSMGNLTCTNSASHLTYTDSIRQSQTHELNVPSDSRNLGASFKYLELNDQFNDSFEPIQWVLQISQTAWGMSIWQRVISISPIQQSNSNILN